MQLDQYQHATKLPGYSRRSKKYFPKPAAGSTPKELGLISAIKDLINRFEGEAYPEIFFQYYNIDDKLDDMTALSIYRIIQELITNTIKHATAHEILIQLSIEQNDIVENTKTTAKDLNSIATHGKKRHGV